MNFISSIGFVILGYLCGSLSFSLWITRLTKKIDVRSGGSGHATTTNTIRQAGWTAGIFVLVLDISKGYLPVMLASNASHKHWVIALTAAAAVAGHCWPLFSGFRGGMGLATTGGAILAVNPLAFAISLGLLISLVLVIKHSARASVFTGVALGPFLWLLGQRGAEVWIGVFAGLVIAGRFTIDWRRQYRELWLDREKTPNNS